MEFLEIELASLKETEKIGRLLGETARPGDVIILSGPLGAGKTALTQFIGAGLEVPADYYITSPTFSLMHEYPGRLIIYHMDLYRLSSEEEIEDLGFLDYIYGKGLTVIEWPDRLGSLLPEEYLEIGLDPGKNEDSRNIRLTAKGSRWQDRLATLVKALSDTGLTKYQL